MTDALSVAVSDAYALGFSEGQDKAKSDLAMLVSGYGTQTNGTIAEPNRKDPRKLRAPLRAATATRRKYGYGVVAGVIRNVIQRERINGVSIDRIIEHMFKDFGVEATKTSVRETLKRMSAAEEIESVNRKWFPTDSLRRDLIMDYVADENEAPTESTEEQ